MNKGDLISRRAFLKRMASKYHCVPALGLPYGDNWETLKEALEEEPSIDPAEVGGGCEYCQGDECSPLSWKYGLDHIFPDYKFCPMCGRKIDE